MAVLLALAAVGAEVDAATPRIANGVLSQMHPAVGLLLFYTAEGSPNGSCSGVMVGCDTFITAAHCVCENDADTYAECLSGGISEPSQLRVFLQHGGLLPVRAVAMNEEYDFGVGGDIAVLKLALPINGIAPLPINRKGQPSFGTPATVVGFGNTGVTQAVGIKRAGEVIVAPCLDDHPNDRHVCWSFREPLGEPGSNSNTCEGDSGGPLLVDFGDGDVVAGVASGGNATDCNAPDDSFDTDVFFYRDFVALIGGIDLDNTHCGDLPQVGTAAVTQHQDNDTLSSTEQRYRVEVPAATRLLRIGLNGDSGGGRPGNDFDLLIRHQEMPSLEAYDCRGVDDPRAEFCEITSPQPGAWNILVRNFRARGMFQLTTSVFAGCVADCDGDGSIAAADLQQATAVVLGQQGAATCGAGDANADGVVSIEDLVLAVNASSSCGGAAEVE